MPETYQYEVWNGKEVIGYYSSNYQLTGVFINIYEHTPLKYPYGPYKSIKIPLVLRPILVNGIDFHYRLVLDVRKKSKRQIDLIIK